MASSIGDTQRQQAISQRLALTCSGRKRSRQLRPSGRQLRVRPGSPHTLLSSPVNVVAVGCNLVIVQQFARCSIRQDPDGLLVVLRTKEPV